MKKLQFVVYPAVVLLSIAAAGSVLAQGVGVTSDPYAYGYSQQNEVHSTLSREQVYAQLLKARADHENRFYATYYSQAPDAHSVLSRTEVRAEAIAAERSGLTQAMTGEDSGSFYLAHHAVASKAQPIPQGLVANASR
jgi:hypothetical protein